MAKAAVVSKSETELVDVQTGEVSTVGTPSTAIAAFAPSADGFRRVRTLAVPVLPFPDGATIQCKIVGPIKEGRVIEGGQIKTPARTMEIESRGGDKRTLIANKVLEKELAAGYPDDSYVGKVFLISKQAPKPGKRYATFLLEEIEWTD